jgi:hypothetical protein
MLFRQSLDGSAPKPVSGVPYLDNPAIAPDGERVVGLSGRDLLLVNVCDRSVQPLPFERVALPVAWSADGRSLFLADMSATPPSLLKFELGSKSVTTWKSLQNPQSSSAQLGGVAAAPDIGAYAYSIYQDISRLYVVDGWS